MKWFLFIHPFHRPLSFFFNNIDILNCIEKICFLILVFNVGIYQQRVSLWMNVFHSNLKTIETPRFWDLDLRAKLFCEVFHHNSITSSKERQHILDEMLLARIELLPVFEVLVEIYLVSSPKWSEMFFIHLIDWMVLNRKKNESLIIWFEKRFLSIRSSKCRAGLHELHKNLLVYSKFITV